nr:transglutaminase domain-containing protein [uncultured Carboxylicivirga sp.]
MRIVALISIGLMMGFEMMADINPSLIQNVSKYPKSYRQTNDLAKRINKDYKSEMDKAAAIYTWIGLNVDYDVKTFFSNKNTSVEYSYQTLEEKEAIEKEIFDKIVQSTLRKKEAVCEGYASLYKALCDRCGLECVIVSGSSKNSYRQIGKEPKGSDHAWNAVMINGQWYLLDVTWGAGSVDPSTRKFIKEFTDGYFMMPVDRFFTQHFPQDEKWSFVDDSAKDFAELPFYHHAYLFSDDVLLTPEKGIIKKLKKGEIPFKLKTNRHINQLYFAFERDKKSSLISYNQQEDEVTFTVSVGNRRSGYFTVFADGKPMFSFKLNTK